MTYRSPKITQIVDRELAIARRRWEQYFTLLLTIIVLLVAILLFSTGHEKTCEFVEDVVFPQLRINQESFGFLIETCKKWVPKPVIILPSKSVTDEGAKLLCQVSRYNHDERKNVTLAADQSFTYDIIGLGSWNYEINKAGKDAFLSSYPENTAKSHCIQPVFNTGNAAGGWLFKSNVENATQRAVFCAVHYYELSTTVHLDMIYLEAEIQFKKVQILESGFFWTRKVEIDRKVSSEDFDLVNHMVEIVGYDKFVPAVIPITKVEEVCGHQNYLRISSV